MSLISVSCFSLDLWALFSPVLFRNYVLPQSVGFTDVRLPQTQRSVLTSARVQLAIWWESHTVHRPEMAFHRFCKRRFLALKRKTLNSCDSKCAVMFSGPFSSVVLESHLFYCIFEENKANIWYMYIHFPDCMQFYILELGSKKYLTKTK